MNRLILQIKMTQIKKNSFLWATYKHFQQQPITSINTPDCDRKRVKACVSSIYYNVHHNTIEKGIKTKIDTIIEGSKNINLMAKKERVTFSQISVCFLLEAETCLTLTHRFQNTQWKSTFATFWFNTHLNFIRFKWLLCSVTSHCFGFHSTQRDKEGLGGFHGH